VDCPVHHFHDIAKDQEKRDANNIRSAIQSMDPPLDVKLERRINQHLELIDFLCGLKGGHNLFRGVRWLLAIFEMPSEIMNLFGRIEQTNQFCYLANSRRNLLD
jgi:hypothetical protein